MCSRQCSPFQASYWSLFLSGSFISSSTTTPPFHAFVCSWFSHHMASPLQPTIFLLRVALSVSSPVLSPVLVLSQWHASLNLLSGDPLFLFPGISVLNNFLSMCSSPLATCLYQSSHLSVIFLEASSPFHASSFQMYSRTPLV